MKNEDEMRMRRAVMAVRDRADGEAVTFKWPEGEQPDAVASALKAYARVKKIGLRTESTQLGLRVIRDSQASMGPQLGRPVSARFVEVVALETGQEVIVKCEPTAYAGVRAAVAALGSRRGITFSCNIVEGGMMVSRPDPNAPPRPRSLGGRPRTAMLYDMSALDRLLWADFEVEARQAHQVRACVRRAIDETGWDLMCRVIAKAGDRETLRVHRLDHPAAGPSAAKLSDAALRAWAKRHDLPTAADPDGSTMSELRAMAEDAASLHLVAEHEHEAS